MKKVSTAFVMILMLGLPLRGQDGYPKFELFGGYSFSHSGVYSGTTGHNLNGWGASFFGADTRYFGWTADLSGVYGSEPFTPACITPAAPIPVGCPVGTQNFNAYRFLGGPRFTFRTRRATPFAEFLLGAVSLRQEFDGNHNEFAMGFGGGVDVPIGKHLAYRVFQADYLPAKRPQSIGGGWNHDFRVQTGIVFTFGKR